MEATLMKVLGVISTAALLLMLGAALPAYAQEERHEEAAKPEKQQEEKAKPAKQEEAKPAKQEQQAKPAKQEQQTKSEKQQEAKPAKQEQQAKSEKQQEAKPAKQEEANPAKQEKQARQEEGGKAAGQRHAQRTPDEEKRQRDVPALRLSVRGEGRIPDDRFRSNFGREHNFRIGEPVVVGGFSRFQYGGFWFGFVQPWPVDWYYTDDVYVDYVDGEYYLINPSYPEARVSISVVI
jgi:primosomal protein N'